MTNINSIHDSNKMNWAASCMRPAALSNHHRRSAIEAAACAASRMRTHAMHCGVQNALTEELVGMAAGLKRNAAAMQTAVADRGRLLEEADSALEHNLAGAVRSSKESKVMYRK